MKKIVSTLLAGALAVNLVVVTPLWAEETTPVTGVEQTEVAPVEGDTQTGTDTTVSETNADVTVEATAEEATAEEATAEETVTDATYETDLEDAIEEVDNVLNPDDFLYIFDKLFEKLALTFTFDDEEKVKLLLELAQERLQEIDVMVAEGNDEIVEELLAAYQAKIDEAQEVEEALDSEVVDGTDETVEDETYTGELKTYAYKERNISALTAVYGKVTNENAKAAVWKNILKAQYKQQNHKTKGTLNTGDNVVEDDVNEANQVSAPVKQNKAQGPKGSQAKAQKADKAVKGQEPTSTETNTAVTTDAQTTTQEKLVDQEATQEVESIEEDSNAEVEEPAVKNEKSQKQENNDHSNSNRGGNSRK